MVTPFLIIQLFSLFYDADLFAVTSESFESNYAICCRIKGVISALANIESRMDVCSSLSYDDGPGMNVLTVGALYTKSL